MNQSLLDTILDKVNEHIVNSMYTSIPGVIVNIDKFSTEQRVDVKPLIKSIGEDGVVEGNSVLYNVPVHMLAGGGAHITLPVDIGTLVDLRFAMRDVDKWFDQDGSEQVSDTNRMFNINDCHCVPGLPTRVNNSAPSSTDLQIKFGGSDLSLKPNGGITINASNKVIVEGSTVELGEGAAESVILGDSFAILYNTHTHPVSGTTALATPNLVTTELSSKVKVSA